MSNLEFGDQFSFDNINKSRKENILKSFNSNLDNIQQSDIDQEISKAIELEVIEKGRKAAPIGEIREWSGKKYQKTAQGWIPVKGEKEKRNESKEGKKGEKSTFDQILADKEGRQIVEGIEGLDPKRKDHLPLYQDYKKQLKDKFNYDYKDSDWDSQGEESKPKEDKKEDVPKELSTFLDKFPDNADKWSQATGELVDLANYIDQETGENTGSKERSKSPSEYNVKNKKRIQEGWNKLNEKQKQQVLDHFELKKEDPEPKEKEGSKVIGQTQSGKKIYDKFDHPEHKTFSRLDHEDAALTHNTHTKDKGEESKHFKAADSEKDLPRLKNAEGYFRENFEEYKDNKGRWQVRGEDVDGYWLRISENGNGEFDVMVGQKSKDVGNAGNNMNEFYNQSFSKKELDGINFRGIIKRDKDRMEQIRKEFEAKYAKK